MVQASRCLTSCGEAPQSVQMSLGSPTPYACSPAIDGSVLTVAVRECIVVFGSVSAPRSILGVDAPSVLCCFLAAEYLNLPRMRGDSGGIPSCLCRVYEEQLCDVWSGESRSWVSCLGS